MTAKKHLPPTKKTAKGSPADASRDEGGEIDGGLDERALVRKNAKPRSPRQSPKGPNNRKA